MARDIARVGPSRKWKICKNDVAAFMHAEDKYHAYYTVVLDQYRQTLFPDDGEVPPPPGVVGS